MKLSKKGPQCGDLQSLIKITSIESTLSTLLMA